MSFLFGIDTFIAGFHPQGHLYQGAGFFLTLIKVDAFLSETHSFSTQKTQYPIAKGGFLHTHILPLPPELSIEGVITDTPIGLWNPTTGALESSPGRSKEKAEQLTQIWESGMPFSVNTTLGIYDQYTFDNLTINKKPEDGYSLKFNAKLSFVNVVDSIVIGGAGTQSLDVRVAKKATPRRNFGTSVASLL